MPMILHLERLLIHEKLIHKLFGQFVELLVFSILYKQSRALSYEDRMRLVIRKKPLGVLGGWGVQGGSAFLTFLLGLDEA